MWQHHTLSQIVAGTSPIAAMLDEEETATKRRCKTKPLLLRLYSTLLLLLGLYIGELPARNITNGGDARRIRGCDEAAMQEEAAFSCEMTAGWGGGERDT